MVTPRARIEREDGEWTCTCGNESHLDGFYPYRDGHEIEPVRDGPWDGDTYVCFACLALISAERGEIIGYANVLTTLEGVRIEREQVR